MPVDKESWYVYAQDKGITKSKAQEYWNIAKKEGGEDWEKVFGIFKIIIDNSLKNKKEESYMSRIDYAIKEAEKEKKDDKAEEKRLAPFIGYALKHGISKEDQAKAIFYSVRGAVAKDNKVETDELEAEDLAELWKEYKAAIEKASGSKKDDKKDDKKKESFVTTKAYILEGRAIKEGSTVTIV